MMKKLAALLLLVVFALSLGSFAYAANGDSEVALAKTISGVIDKEEKGMLEISAKDGNKVVLNLGADPYVVDCVTGEPTLLKDRTNDSIVAYYGPVETRSIPPQSNPILIIVNVPDKGIPPHYAQVEKVDTAGDTVKVTIDNGSIIVSINKDTVSDCYLEECSITDIFVGDELLMWYPIVALSHPAQATAEKVLHLEKATEEEVEEIATPEIPDLDYPKIHFRLDIKDTLTVNGVTMVPLRAVAEALGCNVTWNGATRAVTVANKTDTFTITIDANEFSGGTLKSPPVISNDKTFVPVDFFEISNIADCNNETGALFFTAVD